MFTIAPPPLRCIRGRASWVPVITPRRLISTIRATRSVSTAGQSRIAFADARIVVQDMKGTESVGRCHHQGPQRGDIPRIDLQADALASLAAKLLGGFRSLCGAIIRNDNGAGSRSRQSDCGGATNAAGAAGNNRHFILNIHAYDLASVHRTESALL